jgi:hypothetical protein
LTFKLLPILRVINMDSIAYLDIFGWSSSGGLGVLVVGYCGVIGGFGNLLFFFALEESLFVFQFSIGKLRSYCLKFIV